MIRLNKQKNSTIQLGIDGIILTKADADAKGGAALSIGYIIQKPILFLGTGQSYSDIMEFKPEWMVEQIIGWKLYQIQN